MWHIPPNTSANFVLLLFINCGGEIMTNSAGSSRWLGATCGSWFGKWCPMGAWNLGVWHSVRLKKWVGSEFSWVLNIGQRSKRTSSESSVNQFTMDGFLSMCSIHSRIVLILECNGMLHASLLYINPTATRKKLSSDSRCCCPIWIPYESHTSHTLHDLWRMLPILVPLLWRVPKIQHRLKPNPPAISCHSSEVALGCQGCERRPSSHCERHNSSSVPKPYFWGLPV